TLPRKDTLPLYIQDIFLDHDGTDWVGNADSLKEKLGVGFEMNEKKRVPSRLRLPYDHSRIIFKFQAIDLRAPDKLRYRYRLQGGDDEWSAWQKHRKAIFNDLKPGAYTFRVQAKGRKGKRSQGTKSFSFTITPPWWQTAWFRSSSAALFILLLVFFFRWRTATIRKRKAELEEKVEERTKELATKNREITDSIDYASSIQKALLPHDDVLKHSLGKHFVLHLPRDPVSGDFYWSYAPNEKETIWMVADCTGHGVPGAFMSMMGNSLLDEVVVKEGERDPGRILNRLKAGIVDKIGGERRKDGMDAALCYWDRSSGKLHFAGANNPLYLIREGMGTMDPEIPSERLRPFKDSSDGIEVKGDRQAVGLQEGETYNTEAFETLSIVLKDGDLLYTFTDGLPDQFGGPNDKKFGYRRFKKTLIDNAQLDMEEQKACLKKALADWKGDREQVDDICVMGVYVQKAATS
ncbi:MAG: SpoIIE family protein phosphatase, partial [Flavobacteriales bacterium]